MQSLNEEIVDLNEERRKLMKFNRFINAAEKTIEFGIRELSSANGSSSNNFANNVDPGALTCLLSDQKSSQSAELKLALRTWYWSKKIGQIKKDLESFRQETDLRESLDDRFTELHQRKAKLIENAESVWTDELFEVTATEANMLSYMQTLEDTIVFSEEILASLYETKEMIQHLSETSLADQLTKRKSSRESTMLLLDNAAVSCLDSEVFLLYWQTELQHMHESEAIQADFSHLSKLSERFFTQTLEEWMFSDQLNNAVNTIDDTINSVRDGLSRLQTEQRRIKTDLDSLSVKRITLLYNND